MKLTKADTTEKINCCCQRLYKIVWHQLFCGVVLLVVVIVIAVLCMVFANDPEPAFLDKQEVLRQLYAVCPHLQTFHSDQKVVKPSMWSSAKAGVGKKSVHWTVAQCEAAFGVKCMEQPYHGGPYEYRLVKSLVWEPTIGFLAPWTDANTDAPTFWAVDPRVQNLQRCVDKAFPAAPYLSVDVRVGHKNILVLEVNGVFGIPYSWVKTSHLPLAWVWKRVYAGAKRLTTGRADLRRVALAFQKVVLRHRIAKRWIMETL